MFSTGLSIVGGNAYAFAIWYTWTLERTIPWVANGEHPINERNSGLHLVKDGNLLLWDADGSVVWSTKNSNMNVMKVVCLETRNMALLRNDHEFVWESFQYPTDTLLPLQLLRNNQQLILRLWRDNPFKQGYYHLYFDSDNVLQLLYQ